MSTRKNVSLVGYKSMLVTAAIAAFAIPFAVQAADAPKSREEVKKELAKSHKEGTHDMGGEVSKVSDPAAKSTKSRDQVKKDLDKAHKAGTHDMSGEASTAKQPAGTSKASREQVKKDLDKAHKAGTHDMSGEAATPTKKP